MFSQILISQGNVKLRTFQHPSPQTVLISIMNSKQNKLSVSHWKLHSKMKFLWLFFERKSIEKPKIVMAEFLRKSLTFFFFFWTESQSILQIQTRSQSKVLNLTKKKNIFFFLSSDFAKNSSILFYIYNFSVIFIKSFK